MASSEPILSVNPVPDWRLDTAYRDLIGADPSAFAWEWLRRSPVYRTAWAHALRGDAPGPLSFGLEQFEDPARAVPQARPVWCRDILPDALTAHVAPFHGPKDDRVDLRLLSPLVTIVIDDGDVEHLLLSDGRHFLRIDIVTGTLIGCPAPLTYLLSGLTRLRGPIDTLNRLARLVANGRFDAAMSVNPGRQHRSILELRVADALAAGCDQQSIARGLFGSLIAATHWRIESAPFRRRVQRLVAAARAKLDAPHRIRFE